MQPMADHVVRSLETAPLETAPLGTATGGSDAAGGQGEAPVDLTLNAEVWRICMLEGGYPERWPRHSRCPCCDAGELRPLFRKYDFNHSQCIHCGFVCVDPYPPQDILRRLYAGSYYTNFREFYEAQYLRECGDHSMTAAPLEQLDEMIERATEGRGRGDWLDVGGGLGTVADLVRQRRPGWTVTLNELNPRSLELAREIYQLDVVGSDAEELRRSGRSFDVISAVSVLEHTTDPLAFLRSYARLLRPGGVITVIVPQFTHLNASVSKAASPNVTPPFHASLFREEHLRLILNRVRAIRHDLDRTARTASLQPIAPLRFQRILGHHDPGSRTASAAQLYGEAIPARDQPRAKRVGRGGKGRWRSFRGGRRTSLSLGSWPHAVRGNEHGNWYRITEPCQNESLRVWNRTAIVRREGDAGHFRAPRHVCTLDV